MKDSEHIEKEKAHFSGRAENDGILYIVATPIGNLEDLTLRAVKTLSEVDVILAEDTRVTIKLTNFIDNLNFHNPISNFQKKKPLLISYHQHSSDIKKLEILNMLMNGKKIALVTDAGTPGISDPGNELISFILLKVPYLRVIPVPGASAITALLSVSGFDSSKFMFIGFWPKKKVAKTFTLIENTKLNVVFYESPFRIIKTLKLLSEKLGVSRKIVIGRELTKVFETIYRGTIDEVKGMMEKGTVKGEIVVILEN